MSCPVVVFCLFFLKGLDTVVVRFYQNRVLKLVSTYITDSTSDSTRRENFCKVILQNKLVTVWFFTLRFVTNAERINYCVEPKHVTSKRLALVI